MTKTRKAEARGCGGEATIRLVVTGVLLIIALYAAMLCGSESEVFEAIREALAFSEVHLFLSLESAFLAGGVAGGLLFAWNAVFDMRRK